MLRLVVKGERIKQIYKQVVSDKETKKQRSKETNKETNKQCRLKSSSNTVTNARKASWVQKGLKLKFT